MSSLRTTACDALIVPSEYIPLKIDQLIVIVMKSINSTTSSSTLMIASRYNEKHSNFIIAMTKSFLSHKLVSYIITKVLKLIF